MKPGLLAAALAIGAFIPVQAAFNAQLRVVGSPITAAMVNFIVGTLVLVALWFLIGAPWNARMATTGPWWMWLGGLGGATYITGLVILTPRLGAAVTLSLTVAGQTAMALVLDHLGLLGLPIHAISPIRVLGAILVAVGVALIQVG